MSGSIVEGNQVFCPECNRHVQLLSISRAAFLADVSKRTIYNYLEEGSVHGIRIAGKTLRVCTNSLFQTEKCKVS
jgi:predicted transcriptional regulator